MQALYAKYSEDQVSKIGNTIIYLAEKINNISKTRVLKLLYILDELSIKKSGIPFLNLEYKVWKFGPVAEDIFIELSSSPSLLKNYVRRNTSGSGHNVIEPIIDFNDDEFSKNDLNLLDFVIAKFGQLNADKLISYTHRKESLWHNLAKENGILELLENERISSTHLTIDLSKLVEYDERKKQILEDYIYA